MRSKTLVDLEGRFDVTDNISLALGADNLFDEYPDPHPAELQHDRQHAVLELLAVRPLGPLRLRTRFAGLLTAHPAGRYRPEAPERFGRRVQVR